GEVAGYWEPTAFLYAEVFSRKCFSRSGSCSPNGRGSYDGESSGDVDATQAPPLGKRWRVRRVGDVDATLTRVFSWGRHRFSQRLQGWGTVGYGQVELEVTPELATGKDGAAMTTDLNLWLAAAGLCGTLLHPHRQDRCPWPWASPRAPPRDCRQPLPW
ncbi:hypothetical protein, partial [Candidatus Synechococcus spongiarum]